MYCRELKSTSIITLWTSNSQWPANPWPGITVPIYIVLNTFALLASVLAMAFLCRENVDGFLFVRLWISSLFTTAPFTSSSHCTFCQIFFLRQTTPLTHLPWYYSFREKISAQYDFYHLGFYSCVDGASPPNVGPIDCVLEEINRGTRAGHKMKRERTKWDKKFDCCHYVCYRLINGNNRVPTGP